ncbi:Uncharacterised protein [Mycobacterium tuberculosis]|nr:Uncharacterised protein [Mycobacterium tuberculosis]
MLLDHAALEGDDVLGGVGAGDVLPARVRVPFLLDLLRALRGADDRHRQLLNGLSLPKTLTPYRRPGGVNGAASLVC